MTKYLLLFIIAFPVFSLGQDTLVPLEINPYIEDRDLTKSGNSTDSTFIFSYDNLELPIFDDFSTDKWVKYTAPFSGPGVSSVLNYYMLNAGTLQPIPVNPGLCDTTLARKKTVIIVGGIVIDSTYENFTTGIDVLLDDLNDVIVAFDPPVTLYSECYTLIDTLIDGVLIPEQDTIFHDPNFVQDSARVFTADITSSDIWEDDFACLNYRFPVDPKSLGVATLDGVSNDGYPYQFGSPNSQGPADVLTSKPINLAGKSNVYLSFLYQAKGFGNSPENNDSLRLELYAPVQDLWYTEWSVGGSVDDNEWYSVHYNISAGIFLNDGFRFRISNSASLGGQLDHWHIDYVNLRENSSPADTIIDDLAISYPIESLIEDYISVPWDHYNNLTDPSAKMKEDYELLVMNNNVVAKIRNAGQLDIDGSIFSLPVSTPNWNVGANVYEFDVGNQPYFFPQNAASDKGEFDVKMNISTSTTNQITDNDTTYFTQKFKNYYAYDDGTAETGYGIVDNNAQLAYKFEAYEADTLVGILMKFIPNENDVTDNIFLITVWEDSLGLPGRIIYKDDFFSPSNPKYAAAKRQYSFYEFNNNAAIPVPENFFIGFEQIEDQNLFLGYDLNNNNQDKLFYNTGGNWVNASFPGSLIMRPVFSTKLNYTLSVPPKMPEKVEFNIYPNPVSNVLTIEDLMPGQLVSVFDLTGRKVFSGNEQNIDFSDLNTGFYIVTISDGTGKTIYTQKIIKQ